MTRHDMIERIGNKYVTANIEGGEYSYVQEAGSKSALEKAVGHPITHFKLDIRFEKGDIVKVEKSLEKLGDLDCNGFSSNIKRSYYAFDDEKNEKSKLYNYSKYENLICLDNLDNTAVFYGDYLAETRDDDDCLNYPCFSDVEDYLNMFHYGEHDKKLIEIGEKYLKEVMPIEIGNGDKFIVTAPNKKSNYWETKLLDEDDNEYNLIDESEDVGLLSLIVANNLIQKLSAYDNRFDFNYPVFICDSFLGMDENYLQVILKMLKNWGRQTFIILRKPNEAVQSYCDKTVTYYYKEDKTE